MDYKSNKAKKCFKNKQGLVMLLIDEFAPVTKNNILIVRCLVYIWKTGAPCLKYRLPHNWMNKIKGENTYYVL